MRQISAPFGVIAQAIEIWWGDFTQLFVINLVWLACCLTVVLGPPATLGMMYVTWQLLDESAPTLSDFQAGARKYFWSSWLWMGTNLLLVIVWTFNLWFYSNIEASWSSYMRVILTSLMVLWLATQFYALPYLVKQEHKSLKTAWKNGFLTLLASPGFALIIGIFAIIIIASSMIIIIPVFMGTGSLLMLLAAAAVQDRLEAFEIIEKNNNASR